MSRNSDTFRLLPITTACLVVGISSGLLAADRQATNSQDSGASSGQVLQELQTMYEQDGRQMPEMPLPSYADQDSGDIEMAGHTQVAQVPRTKRFFNRIFMGFKRPKLFSRSKAKPEPKPEEQVVFPQRKKGGAVASSQPSREKTLFPIELAIDPSSAPVQKGRKPAQADAPELEEEAWPADDQWGDDDWGDDQWDDDDWDTAESQHVADNPSGKNTDDSEPDSEWDTDPAWDQVGDDDFNVVVEEKKSAPAADEWGSVPENNSAAESPAAETQKFESADQADERPAKEPVAEEQPAQSDGVVSRPLLDAAGNPVFEAAEPMPVTGLPDEEYLPLLNRRREKKDLAPVGSPNPFVQQSTPMQPERRPTHNPFARQPRSEQLVSTAQNEAPAQIDGESRESLDKTTGNPFERASHEFAPAEKSAPVPGTWVQEPTDEEAFVPAKSGVVRLAGPSKPAKTEPIPDSRNILRGYCPVVLREKRSLVPGNKDYIAIYRGHVYYFVSAAAKRAFEENPAYYAPAYAGLDLTLLRGLDVEKQGTLANAAWFQDQLYLFSSKRSQETFMANPEQYLP